jgi:hypothetical protein
MVIVKFVCCEKGLKRVKTHKKIEGRKARNAPDFTAHECDLRF